MTNVPPLPDSVIESVSKALGDAAKATEISEALQRCAIDDNSVLVTKWRRLQYVFLERQQQDQSANSVLRFTKTLLEPARFVGRNDEFENHRYHVNVALAFAGLELGADGNIRRHQAATTIAEAEQRADTLRTRLNGRRIHPQVMKYCKAELMQDNYFHAVFEASKGLAQRIRDESGVEADGAKLVDQVFSVKNPVITFNDLRTETERSEHVGFATLLKGCFGAVRNPAAHQPKLLWEGEDDAADYFTLISLLHRKLDGSRRVRTRGGA